MGGQSGKESEVQAAERPHMPVAVGALLLRGSSALALDSVRCDGPNKPALTLAPWEITLGAGVAGTIVWIFAMRAAYAGEDPESGFALVYWSVAILSIALGGLYQCLKRVKEAGQTVNDLPWRHRYAHRRRRIVCVRACGVHPSSPAIYFRHPRTSAVNAELLTRLALDIGQGLAYDVVMRSAS